jgi:hypothetical protein
MSLRRDRLPVVDDGHCRSLLSRILAAPRLSAEDAGIEEPSPTPFQSGEDLVECVVSLPQDEVVKVESAEPPDPHADEDDPRNRT